MTSDFNHDKGLLRRRCCVAAAASKSTSPSKPSPSRSSSAETAWASCPMGAPPELLASGSRTQHEACRLDLGRQLIERDGQIRPLTTQEAELLTSLSERPGTASSRDELHREIWGHGDPVVSRSVDDTILRLRPKIERDTRAPRHLRTMHGMGYRFEP